MLEGGGGPHNHPVMKTAQPVSRAEADRRFEFARATLAERIATWTVGLEQFKTATPNLTPYRHDAPTGAMSCMAEPAIALTVQSAKRALLGDQVFDYHPHRFLITSLDLPVVLRAVKASQQAPSRRRCSIAC